ncbi:MAG: hypothetical protein ACE37B_06460 [Ilumatobacter sp.]|uniref:hypothetical protein n=1 Tax=Ilumatobacter sp. TaxID=1967498 RepID=UPI00391C4865
MPNDTLQSARLDTFRRARPDALTRRRRRLVPALMALTLAGAACGSDDGSDPEPTDPPVNEGTVIPPEDVGIGGGVPVDNLDPDVADQEYQEEFDMDGSGGP